MDWTTIVSLAGIIGTWITIALVYFTLKEMRNQRKASLKPDLMIPKSSFHGYGYGYGSQLNFEHLLIPLNWTISEDVKEDETQAPSDIWLQSAPLTLYNVGFGVAKNIELRWTIQYDKTLQEIKDYCYKHSVPIIIEQDEKGFSYSEGGVSIEGFYQFHPQTVQHDFLMPASITSEGLISYLPETYHVVVSILLYLRFRHGLWINEETGTIPPPIVLPSIELELLYDDVENTRYSKRFEVLFSTTFFTYFNEKGILGLKKMFSGSLEFRSKS